MLENPRLRSRAQRIMRQNLSASAGALNALGKLFEERAQNMAASPTENSIRT